MEYWSIPHCNNGCTLMWIDSHEYCYYTFNYKDHWDSGLAYMLHITLLILLNGCISQPAIGCPSNMNILSQ